MRRLIGVTTGMSAGSEHELCRKPCACGGHDGYYLVGATLDILLTFHLLASVERMRLMDRRRSLQPG
jgi:hypothetical protein